MVVPIALAATTARMEDAWGFIVGVSCRERRLGPYALREHFSGCDRCRERDLYLWPELCRADASAAAIPYRQTAPPPLAPKPRDARDPRRADPGAARAAVRNRTCTCATACRGE